MMSTKHKQRLSFVLILIVAFATATVLILYAFEKNLLYFYTPTQVADKSVSIPSGRNFNIGGLVKEGSVKHKNMTIRFEITDMAKSVPVLYTGLLPDLFREGQGIVATGLLDSAGTFQAETVLAKHDENYMPPAAAEALRQAGQPISIKSIP